jgi:hypothetical protein
MPSLLAVDPCAPARPERALGLVGVAARALGDAARVRAAVARAVDAGVDLIWVETAPLAETAWSDAAFGFGFAVADALAEALARDGAALPLMAHVRHDDAEQVAGLLAGGVTALVADSGAPEAAARSALSTGGAPVPLVRADRLRLQRDGDRCALPPGAFALVGSDTDLLLTRPVAPVLGGGGEESQIPSSLATPLAPAA